MFATVPKTGNCRAILARVSQSQNRQKHHTETTAKKRAKRAKQKQKKLAAEKTTQQVLVMPQQLQPSSQPQPQQVVADTKAANARLPRITWSFSKAMYGTVDFARTAIILASKMLLSSSSVEWISYAGGFEQTYKGLLTDEKLANAMQEKDEAKASQATAVRVHKTLSSFLELATLLLLVNAIPASASGEKQVCFSDPYGDGYILSLVDTTYQHWEELAIFLLMGRPCSILVQKCSIFLNAKEKFKQHKLQRMNEVFRLEQALGVGMNQQSHKLHAQEKALSELNEMAPSLHSLLHSHEQESSENMVFVHNIIGKVKSLTRDSQFLKLERGNKQKECLSSSIISLSYSLEQGKGAADQKNVVSMLNGAMCGAGAVLVATLLVLAVKKYVLQPQAPVARLQAPVVRLECYKLSEMGDPKNCTNRLAKLKEQIAALLKKLEDSKDDAAPKLRQQLNELGEKTESVPSHLQCVTTRDIFDEPVDGGSGIFYERRGLLRQIAMSHRTCMVDRSIPLRVEQYPAGFTPADFERVRGTPQEDNFLQELNYRMAKLVVNRDKKASVNKALEKLEKQYKVLQANVLAVTNPPATDASPSSSSSSNSDRLRRRTASAAAAAAAVTPVPSKAPGPRP